MVTTLRILLKPRLCPYGWPLWCDGVQRLGDYKALFFAGGGGGGAYEILKGFGIGRAVRHQGHKLLELASTAYSQETTGLGFRFKVWVDNPNYLQCSPLILAVLNRENTSSY